MSLGGDKRENIQFEQNRQSVTSHLHTALFDSITLSLISHTSIEHVMWWGGWNDTDRRAVRHSASPLLTVTPSVRQLPSSHPIIQVASLLPPHALKSSQHRLRRVWRARI